MGMINIEWLDEIPVAVEIMGTDLNRIPVIDKAFFRESLQRGQLTGGRSFIEKVEKMIGRRVEPRGPGHPRRTGLFRPLHKLDINPSPLEEGA